MTDHDTDYAETDLDNAMAIQERVVDAIGPEPMTDTLEALVGVFTFLMSLGCAQCRRNIAHALHQRLPKMLAEADAVAAKYPPDEHSHCH
jgi:hypothetical protein